MISLKLNAFISRVLDRHRRLHFNFSNRIAIMSRLLELLSYDFNKRAARQLPRFHFSLHDDIGDILVFTSA